MDLLISIGSTSDSKLAEAEKYQKELERLKTLDSASVQNVEKKAIQDGPNGPILPLTKENLMPMVITNPEALKQAEKNHLFRAINIFNERRR